MYMKVFKGNQIIIFVLALMLITAGYLSTINQNDKLMVSANSVENVYNDNTLGDATLVNGGAIVNNDDLSNSIKETNANKAEDEYFASSKLEREKMYSQQIESYQKMIDSTTISNEQKAIAENEIKRINDEKNSIMIIENLIKTKGFENVVLFINGDSINAVLKAEKLNTQEIAQIQNIISRELNVDINNIHISNK